MWRWWDLEPHEDQVQDLRLRRGEVKERGACGGGGTLSRARTRSRISDCAAAPGKCFTADLQTCMCLRQ